ncbi:hypothetical protein ACU61A_20630 [Pseudonocardia sichuanensis]
MEEDAIRILATATAGLLIRAMGTAAWRATRDRWARILGRGDHEDEGVVAQRLQETADAVEGSDPAGRQDAESELRGLIGKRLQDDPDLVDAVRAGLPDQLYAGFGMHSPVRQTATVWNGTSIQSGRDTTIDRLPDRS